MTPLGPTHYAPFYVRLVKLDDLGNSRPDMQPGYCVEGWSTMKPTVDLPYTFIRTVKNTGKSKLGLFTTSHVQSVVTTDDKPDEIRFDTANSRYLLTIDRTRVYREEDIVALGLDTAL